MRVSFFEPGGLKQIRFERGKKEGKGRKARKTAVRDRHQAIKCNCKKEGSNCKKEGGNEEREGGNEEKEEELKQRRAAGPQAQKTKP